MTDDTTPPAYRREALKALYEEARGCTRCAELAATRQTVVFGAGNADADLMFVGEAPGATEDKLGLPFVGQAGKLLEQLLDEIGIARADVFIANVLKCRPPSNRDPQPGEIENCRPYLSRQVELIEPRVICTLGNFATKLLRDDPTGITRIHGRPEVLLIGSRPVRIFPIYHPAAALYTRSMLDTLRADFSRLPGLLALDPPTLEAPAPPAERPPAATPPAATSHVESAPKEPARPAPTPAEPAQLGLFE
jgi:uracil-DNA glycosylase